MANGELVEQLGRMVVAKHKAEMEIVELMKKNGQLGKEKFKMEIEGVGMKRKNHELQGGFDAARERVDALNSRNEELEREIQSLKSGANKDILENRSVDRESSEILGEDYDQSESQADVTGGENSITQAEPHMPIEDPRVRENPNEAVEPSMILE